MFIIFGLYIFKNEVYPTDEKLQKSQKGDITHRHLS